MVREKEDVKKLKEDVKNLSFENLRDIYLSAKTNQIKRIIKERLIYLCEFGKTPKIAEECFELVEPKLSKEDLIYLCKFGKTPKITKECFELIKLQLMLIELQESKRLNIIKNKIIEFRNLFKNNLLTKNCPYKSMSFRMFGHSDIDKLNDRDLLSLGLNLDLTWLDCENLEKSNFIQISKNGKNREIKRIY